jgi:magnesium chelatase subunit I
VHYGLVPRTNRGIFSVNELPDLAERIQVSLLNVLEERDIQVRGYTLRLPLDLLLVASRTRGLHQPRPHHHAAQGPLRRRGPHALPARLTDEIGLLRQEAAVAAVVPDHLLEVVARFTRMVRESPAVDARSGVSARFAVAAAETAAASALRRAALTGEDPPVTRVCDLPAVVDTVRGKVEFEVSEEGNEREVLTHLLRRATVETFRAHLSATDLGALIERFDAGLTIETGDLVPAARLLEQLGPLPGLAHVLERLGMDDGAETPALAAAAIEFAMEGLFLNRRIAKDEVPVGDGRRTVYGG